MSVNRRLLSSPCNKTLGAGLNGMNMKGALLLAATATVQMVIRSPAAAHSHVRLIIRITADQLSGDCLDRYRTALANGFAKIEAQGY
jgi:hypothetical protein